MPGDSNDSNVLRQAKEELDSIYETTLRIFEVPYDPKTKKPIAREEPLSDEEHKRILDRVHLRINRLRTRTQAIQNELHMSHDEMITFLENPNNFTPDQWDILQEMKKQIDSFRSQVVMSLSGEKKKSSLEGRKKLNPSHKKMKKSKRING